MLGGPVWILETVYVTFMCTTPTHLPIKLPVFSGANERGNIILSNPWDS